LALAAAALVSVAVRFAPVFAFGAVNEAGFFVFFFAGFATLT
jgi:hypothetical protein